MCLRQIHFLVSNFLRPGDYGRVPEVLLEVLKEAAPKRAEGDAGIHSGITSSYRLPSRGAKHRGEMFTDSQQPFHSRARLVRSRQPAEKMREKLIKNRWEVLQRLNPCSHVRRLLNIIVARRKLFRYLNFVPICRPASQI